MMNQKKIHFGVDWLSAIGDLAQRCKNERFLLITSKSFSKRGLSEQIANAFGKQLVSIVDEISPNPKDYGLDSAFINEIFATLNARAKNGIFDTKRVKEVFLTHKISY